MTTGPELIIKLDEREQFLAERREIIGGSDVWRILSGDALGVYVEKKGLVPALADNEFMRMGRRLERAILEEYAERTGFRMSYPKELIRHPDLKFAGGHVDGIATTADDDNLVSEAKNVDVSKMKEWGEEGSDNVPERYIWQCQWYCFISEHIYHPHRADLSALFGGNRHRIFELTYDRELIEAVMDDLERFAWHLQNNIPPEPTFTLPNALTVQKQLHSEFTKGDIRQVDDPDGRLLALVTKWQQAKNVMNALDKVKDGWEAEIRHEIGDKEGIKIGDSGATLMRSYVGEAAVPASTRRAYTTVKAKFPKESNIELPAPAKLLEAVNV